MPVTAIGAALLGIVQGLTEFLPVSSSAHLILARAFVGWDAEGYGLAFDVAVHVGTLLAIVLFFRRDLVAMAAAVPAAMQGNVDGHARMLGLVVAGTLPILPAGLLYTDRVEATLRTPAVAAAMLALGAAAFLFVERASPRRRDETTLRPGEAVWLGVAQAAALVPGVSRSGATIALGMFFGLRREAAARFGFLLGVPAISAAAAREGVELARMGLGVETAAFFGIGVATSAVVGYLTVKYFIRFLSGHSLDGFAYYRLALAAITVLWILNH
jgi:undecaprenyl-diphosphatase